MAPAQQWGRAMKGAPSLFGDSAAAASTSVAGLQVALPTPCRCGETIAIAGSSCGPHHARIDCSACGTHRAWMSGATFNFLGTVIDQFGRPIEPILISTDSRTRVDNTATTT